MTLAGALALLLVSAPPAALDEARRAFAAGDYVSAERLALAAEADAPDAALYVAGLARFRAGRPAEALEALERGEAGADSPAAWRFNRGACLYELGRHAEAEEDFLAAAADAELRALALVNAGFAALDAGSPERARAIAARARAAATGEAVALVTELEQAIAPAVDADAVEAGSPPAPARSITWSAWGHAGGGWDGDATRAGVGAVERPGTVNAVESGFLAGGAGAGLAAGAGAATVALDYGVQQLAYVAAAAEDHGVQQHDAILAFRTRRGEALDLEVAAFGQYALAGLSRLRGMQASAGLRVAEAIAWTDRQTTRVALTATAKDGRGVEFQPLDGSRLELVASHEVALGWLLATAGYRFQLERIGDQRTPLAPFPSGSPMCPQGCAAVEVQPLAYVGHTASLALRVEPWSWLRADATAGVEGRRALEDIQLVLTGPDGVRVAGGRHRTDLRAFGSEALALRLARVLSVVLRHDWLRNETRLEPSGAAAARRTTTTAWDKHVLTAAVAVEW